MPVDSPAKLGTSSKLLVSVITQPKAFSSLASDWEGLVQASGNAVFFLSHTWLNALIACESTQQLFVVTVRDSQGRLVGATPWKIGRRVQGSLQRFLRRVEFIGTNSDFGEMHDILVAQDVDEEAVLQAMADGCIAQSGKWDVMDWRFIVASPRLSRLAELLMAKQAYGADVYPCVVVRKIDLPATYDEYAKKIRKKKMSANLTNRKNKLAQDFPGQVVEFVPDAPDQWDAFARHHSDYWQARGGRGFGDFPAVLECYKSLGQRCKETTDSHRNMILSGLVLDNKYICYMAAAVHDDGCVTAHLTWFDADYNRYSPGLLMFESLIEHAISLGAKTFYFGRGDDEYKTRWTDDHVPLYHIAVYQSWWVFVQARLDYWIRKALVSLGLVQKKPSITPETAKPMYVRNQAVSFPKALSEK